MTRKLTFDRIATTEDSNDPVVRAELTDTESFGYFIIPTDLDRIHVYLIESQVRGDMKLILDEVVEQLNTNELWFLWPLDDAKPDRVTKLEDRLHGFEEIVKEVHFPDKGEVKMNAYVGEWNP